MMVIFSEFSQSLPTLQHFVPGFFKFDADSVECSSAHQSERAAPAQRLESSGKQSPDAASSVKDSEFRFA